MSWSDPRRRLHRPPAALAVLAALVLAGCGFHPLYGTVPESSGGVALRQIAVGSVGDAAQPRTAQLLRNDLLDRLNPDGKPVGARYGLNVSLIENLSQLAITQTGQVTRNNLTLTATYTLTDLKTGAALHSATLHAETSYSILRVDYGNVVAARSARARLAQELSDQITSEIGAWLMRPGAALP